MEIEPEVVCADREPPRILSPSRACRGARLLADSLLKAVEIRTAGSVEFSSPTDRSTLAQAQGPPSHPERAAAPQKRPVAGMDRLSVHMVRTGAPSDAVELVEVDEAGELVPRPGVQ